jgi:hypothetical protein
MLNITLLIIFFVLIPAFFVLFNHIFNNLTNKNIILRYIIFIFISSLFIIIQSISIRHNFFESLNELLFIYLWWYFIFSMYGLYRKEHYLRLLEPIKFSLNPIYFYKLVKRSIKIRFIVMKELFLSLNLKDCIIVGLIFIMSYACLRILRACLIYELITIYGLEEKVTKYLSVLVILGYEMLLWVKEMSKPLIKMCKTPIIEAMRGLILGEMYYTYIKMNAKQISKTEKTGLEELRKSVLTMKKAAKNVYNVIRGDNPHIKVEGKPIEIAELENLNSKTIVIPAPQIIETMIESERKKLEIHSESGVALVNEQTGLPNYIVSKSGEEVCRMENYGDWEDTPKRLKKFRYLNADAFQKYFACKTVEEKYSYLKTNIVNLQQAYKYQKLHEQYNKGGYMYDNARKTYENHQKANPGYIKIVKQFTNSVVNDLAPYIIKTKNLSSDQKLNFDQIFYEMNIADQLEKNTANTIVKFTETTGYYNEPDGKLINTVTKEEQNIQMKTVTNTNFIESGIANNIERYCQHSNFNKKKQKKFNLTNTHMLVQSVRGATVTIDLEHDNLKKLFEKEKNPSNESILSSSEKIKLAQTKLYNPIELQKKFLDGSQVNFNINIEKEKNKMD